MLRGLDENTVREELDAMQSKPLTKKDMEYAVHCIRWLRQIERKESDHGRNAVIGY